jgi:alpha-L-fucosidase 2
MKIAHIGSYQKLFNRVKLDLGTTIAAKLPTDERCIKTYCCGKTL